MTRNFIAALAATTALTAAMPAFAQVSSAPEANTGGLEEIVVTAQKREQNLQDVPIAVTAITGDSLATNRVTSVSDLSGLAPGGTPPGRKRFCGTGRNNSRRRHECFVPPPPQKKNRTRR